MSITHPMGHGPAPALTGVPPQGSKTPPEQGRAPAVLQGHAGRVPHERRRLAQRPSSCHSQLASPKLNARHEPGLCAIVGPGRTQAEPSSAARPPELLVGQGAAWSLPGLDLATPWASRHADPGPPWAAVVAAVVASAAAAERRYLGHPEAGARGTYRRHLWSPVQDTAAPRVATLRCRRPPEAARTVRTAPRANTPPVRPRLGGRRA